jgi:hypothetical protein
MMSIATDDFGIMVGVMLPLKPLFIYLLWLPILVSPSRGRERLLLTSLKMTIVSLFQVTWLRFKQ